MKTIKKIQIIDAPKELQLNDEDLLNFMGGVNCISYEHCSFLFDSTCGSFNSSACDDGSGSDVKCISYDF